MPAARRSPRTANPARRWVPRVWSCIITFSRRLPPKARPARPINGVAMNYREYQQIDRRKSRQISVGNVKVGGDAPVSVQTMTNTLTTDVEATVAQILRAEAAGVDIVRVSCPDEESTAALKHIVKRVNVPVVADIHFHYKRGIEAAQAGAACLRINPGNIGSPPPARAGRPAPCPHRSP